MGGRARRWVTVLSSVLIVAAGITAQGIASADPTAVIARPSREALRAEAAFRRDLALDSGAAHLRAVHTDASAVRLYGMPFTPAEARELRERITAGDQINAVAQRHLGAKRTAAFAGTYLDHAAGGVLTVLVTANRDAHLAALRRQVSHPERLRVRQVRYSLAALGNARASADAALRRAGLAVSLTSIDVVRNRVTVTVPDASAQARAGLARLASSDMLDVVSGAPELADCANLTCVVCADDIYCAHESPPLDGGTDIESYDAYPGEVAFCTLGFVGHKGSATQSFVLSAGHCGPTTSVWAQQVTPIGMVGKNTFTGTTRADAFSIAIPRALGRGYVKASSGTFRRISGRELSNKDYVGKPTCAYGIRTRYRCGKITTRTAQARFVIGTGSSQRIVTLKDQRIASRPCGPGDSGGPNFYGSTAQGLTSYSVRYSDGRRHCGYSHIGHVLAATGLTSVTSR